MPPVSAGLLMCQRVNESTEFFLVHPGGPFFVKKNEGVWSIPKGLVEEGETPDVAAVREFREETGINPVPPFFPIGSVTLASRKIIHAWTFMGAWELAPVIVSDMFELEWPPKSGEKQSFPEIDRAGWFSFEAAKEMITAKQVPFLERALAFWNTRN